MRIGWIGTGSFTRFHFQLLSRMEGVDVRAVCGTGLDKAERFAADWPNASAYDRVDRMLDETPLDAVYVCVPPMAHGPIEESLIERGIPFFVEKPVGLDMDTPSRIARRVAEKGLITSVGYHFRYSESTDKLLEVLRETKPGMAAGYWMGSMPKVAWWRNLSLSGGQIIEQTTHMADLLRYALGEIEEVYAAFAGTIMHELEPGVTVPDTGHVTLKFAGGLVASLSNTCVLPEAGRIGLSVYTRDGVVEWNRNSLIFAKPQQQVEYKFAANPYEKEHAAFLHAVRTGDRSQIRSPYEDALRTQAVTVAAVRSAETGQPVKLNL